MSVLNKISDVLKTLATDADVPMCGVWYGACREKNLDKWNYFVFNRSKRTKNNTSRCDFQTFYQVHIIHENYIPEGYIDKVIEALQTEDMDGTKLKATVDDIVYNYTFKGNTNMVVEIATITFFHPEKRC